MIIKAQDRWPSLFKRPGKGWDDIASPRKCNWILIGRQLEGWTRNVPGIFLSISKKNVQISSVEFFDLGS